MAVATPDDVARAIGRPLDSPDERGQVSYWLEAVELMIAARLGPVALLDQNVVNFVEIEAVTRRMVNPNGYQSETVDDYTYRFGSETRNITILDEWWKLLDADFGSAVFSARPQFEPDHALPPLDWS